jgi:methionyl-tRNA formyltransferase
VLMTGHAPARSEIGSRPGLRIGWVGSHFEGCTALEALADREAGVVTVITLFPEAISRRSGAVDLAPLVEPYGIEVHRVVSINDAESIAFIGGGDLDLLLVIGWSQILNKEVLAIPRLGVVGAHASYLPKNRGSAPVNWSIIRGEETTGNTLLWLTEGVDEGEIIDQTEIAILPYDTCNTIYQKVADSNRDMILRLLDRLSVGDRPGRPQPSVTDAKLPRRAPGDGAIDWGQRSGDVYNFVRALTRPYPGSFSSLDNVRWIVWRAALLPTIGIAPGPPGTTVGAVVSPMEDACGQMVCCGDGAVVLLEVEREDGTVLNGRALSEQQWAAKIWATQ